MRLCVWDRPDAHVTRIYYYCCVMAQRLQVRRALRETDGPDRLCSVFLSLKEHCWSVCRAPLWNLTNVSSRFISTRRHLPVKVAFVLCRGILSETARAVGEKHTQKNEASTSDWLFQFTLSASSVSSVLSLLKGRPVLTQESLAKLSAFPATQLNKHMKSWDQIC